MKCSVCNVFGFIGSKVTASVMSMLLAAAVIFPASAFAGGGKLPPLTVSKTGPATAKVGDIIVYELAITSTQKGDYHKVDIHEVAPKCLQFVKEQSSPECGQKGGTLGCWVNGLWGRMTKKFNMAFRVTEQCACNQQLVNQIDVSAKNADPNWAKAMTTISCEQKKIIVSKTGPATVNQGGTISYSVTVTNPGTVALDTVAVYDAVPAGLTFLSASAPECSLQGNAVVCAVGALGAGQSKTYTFTFQVAPTAQCGKQIVNQVDVSAAGADPNWAKAMTTVNCEQKKILVTKTGPATVNQGGTISYTIAVTNPGAVALDTVAISDAIPTGLTFQSASAPECSQQGNAVVCAVGVLGAGQTKNYTFTFKVSPTADCGMQIVNQVDVSAAGAEPNWAKHMTQVTCEKKKILITKTGPTTVIPGESVTYTIAVTNPNTTPLTNVSLFDGLVQGLTFLPQTSDATCAAGAQGVSCTNFNLAAGETKTFSLSFGLAATLACNTQIVNQVDVRADGAEANWAKAMSQVSCPKRTINVIKTGPAKVLQGGNISYTITVTNPNQVALQNVSVYDGIPAGLTFVEQGSSPECKKQGNAVICTPFDLAAGQSKVFTLVFKVSATAVCDSQIVNQVDVSAKNTDPNWAKAMTIVECVKPAASPILPLLECVYDMGNGSYRAYFGYENTGNVAHTIQAGTDTNTTQNTFVPEPKSRGQISTFNPGRVKAAFFVDFDGAEIVWKIRPENGTLNSAAASKTSAACKPVEPIAECVDKKSDKFNALFGYLNGNPFEVKIPVGVNNKFTPDPQDRGQPNQFFTGRVASAFSVQYTTPEVTWKLGTLQATAKFGKEPRCTPGKAPVCGCGVAQNLECQGATTKVHLDGTTSKDPDGDPLTYKWTTNCPKASFDNDTAAQPVLTIDTSTGEAVSCTVSLTVSDGTESSSCSSPVNVKSCNVDCAGVPNGSGKVDMCGVCNGNNSCIDCAGVPNGNSKIDKCGVCGGNDSCIDCAGVPNGAAKPDRCGVCNGNGQSCIDCKSTDITDQLFGMDIAAAVQKNIILKAAKKVAKLPGASQQVKSLASESTKEANALYQRMWTSTWGLGRTVNNCANATICTQNDRITTLSSYNTDSVRLRDIALELSRACSNLSRGSDKSSTSCKRIANDANDAHQAALQSVTQVPRFDTTCN